MDKNSIQNVLTRKKILVVDDDPGILDVLHIMLEESGYDVETSQDAVTIAKKLTPPPDLILLDMWMSGINGKDVCKRLKKQAKTKHITVIMISANNDTGLIAQECGADAFILKPFQMDDLLALIQKFI